MLIRAVNAVASKWYHYFDYLITIVTCFILKCSGVTLGSSVIFHGFPHLSVAAGSKVVIGKACVFRSRSFGNAIGVNHRIVVSTLSPAAELIIGEHVGISGGAICAKQSVIIGSYCLLGANVVISDNDFHPIKSENRRYNHTDNDIIAQPVFIGNNVWICADSYILKGVHIGDNTIVGAGSVVSHDIPANSIAVGNPAKVIKKLYLSNS